MGNWGHPLRPLRPHWPPHPPDLGCCMILGSSHTFIQALGTARLGNCSSSEPLPPPGCPSASQAWRGPRIRRPLATPARLGPRSKTWCKCEGKRKPSLGGGTPFSWPLGRGPRAQPQSRDLLPPSEGALSFLHYNSTTGMDLLTLILSTQ